MAPVFSALFTQALTQATEGDDIIGIAGSDIPG
ncbi:MAG: hypothetical protein K0Q80_3053, partial [Microvirga sp.]|nr:hypothetical protein [Microvirga sp.]